MTDKAKLQVIGGRLPTVIGGGGPLFHIWSRRGKPRILNFGDGPVAKVEIEKPDYSGITNR
jgi:hypothetical protein